MFVRKSLKCKTCFLFYLFIYILYFYILTNHKLWSLLKFIRKKIKRGHVNHFYSQEFNKTLLYVAENPIIMMRKYQCVAWPTKLLSPRQTLMTNKQRSMYFSLTRTRTCKKKKSFIPWEEFGLRASLRSASQTPVHNSVPTSLYKLKCASFAI